jgi:hypothetical protein
MWIVRLENVNITFNILKRTVKERNVLTFNVNVSFVFYHIILSLKNSEDTIWFKETEDILCLLANFGEE